MEVAVVSVHSQDSRWSVEIYEVVDHDHQQRILEVFLEIGQPHVIALGTQRGHRSYVIVEVSSAMERAFARRTITAIDSHATRTYSSNESPVSGPMLA